jgi:transposase
LRSIRTYLATLAQQFGQTISRSSFRRWLKNWGKVYKRAKRSCKAHRDQSLFSVFQEELQALKEWEDQGQIDLFFYDEMGLNLIPSIPYGWQTKGETVEIPSIKSSNISTAGFLSRDNRFTSWVVEGAINTEMTVKIFDAFANTLAKQTVVILDNASIHTSKHFQEHIAGWRQKGLLIQYIPAHCPELNYIEMLWHKIKYEWLEIQAFNSKDSLVLHLNEILKGVGQKYRITFS